VTRPAPGPAAVAGVTLLADCLEQGACTECVADAFRILSDTDIETLGYVAALLVHKLGGPARDVLREIGMSALHGAEAPGGGSA
jgi:hypothetical protein